MPPALSPTSGNRRKENEEVRGKWHGVQLQREQRSVHYVGRRRPCAIPRDDGIFRYVALVPADVRAVTPTRSIEPPTAPRRATVNYSSLCDLSSVVTDTKEGGCRRDFFIPRPISSILSDVDESYTLAAAAVASTWRTCR